MVDVSHRAQNRDEIDLLELIRGLWAKRVLIISVTAVVGALAALYAFTATRYYQVTSVLQPPVLKDLDELNEAGAYNLSPEEALRRVGVAVASYDNRLAFARENQDRLSFLKEYSGSFEQAFEDFSADAFAITQPDPKKPNTLTPFIGLSFTYPEGVDGADYVNDFIRFSLDKERQKLKGDFETVIANKLAAIERKIGSYRASYEVDKKSRIAKLLEDDTLKIATLRDELTALRKQLQTRRNNRIALLEENIAIARTLGINKPTTPASLSEADRVSRGNVIRTEVNNQSIPLYFMGVETLEAERNTLLKRTSDDFTEPRIAEIQKELQLLEKNRQVEVLKQRENEDLFLKALTELREEEARLKGLSVDFSTLKLVTIDRVAAAPLKAAKPKRLLVLAGGLVVGGMLGVFVALLQMLFSSPRRKESRRKELPPANEGPEELPLAS